VYKLKPDGFAETTFHRRNQIVFVLLVFSIKLLFIYFVYLVGWQMAFVLQMGAGMTQAPH
jgi:hypothetical protein